MLLSHPFCVYCAELKCYNECYRFIRRCRKDTIYKQSGELNRLSMTILNNYNLSGGDKIE